MKRTTSFYTFLITKFSLFSIRWGSPSSASQAQSTPVPRRKRQRAKGGRALGGLFTPYYTSAGNDDIDNSIPSSTGNQILIL